VMPAGALPMVQTAPDLLRAPTAPGSAPVTIPTLAVGYPPINPTPAPAIGVQPTLVPTAAFTTIAPGVPVSGLGMQPDVSPPITSLMMQPPRDSAPPT